MEQFDQTGEMLVRTYKKRSNDVPVGVWVAVVVVLLILISSCSH